MLVTSRPGAYPVTGFPARAGGGAAATKGKGSDSGHVGVEWGGGGVLLGGTALETAGAAGEVVGSAVSNGAVPVTGANIGAGGEAKGGRASATKSATVVTTTPWLPAPLARFSSLEVQVVACPAVPISWSAHFPSLEFGD